MIYEKVEKLVDNNWIEIKFEEIKLDDIIRMSEPNVVDKPVWKVLKEPYLNKFNNYEILMKPFTNI